MNLRALLVGHKMKTESRPVTRYTSSLNMDYEDTDLYIVCECGYEKKLYKFGRNDTEERIVRLEHSTTVLGVAILGEAVVEDEQV